MITEVEEVVLSFWNRELGVRQNIPHKTVEVFQRHYERKCRELGLDSKILPRLDEC